MSISVQLHQFEGPLALLLYLIRKEEMDIMDIKIHEITKQYFDYIKLMKELDLEVAGEFVAMASTLIQIKSRMLIPQYDENGEVVENDDPRKELVQRLLEYQKFQEAAKMLIDRPLLGRDQYPRGSRETLESPDEKIVVEDNGLYQLIAMYRRAMKSLHKRVHRVTAKTQSISERIMEFKDFLMIGRRVSLRDLLGTAEEHSRQLLITFLSLLELGKLGFVNLYQTDNYSDIWIEARKPIGIDVISRVEEYSNVNSENTAAALFAKTEEAPAEITEEMAYAMIESDGGTDEDLFEVTAEAATDEEITAAERDLSDV
ncbi:MAG: segregation/condensation protein A [Bdellovibrionota bacterium]